MKSRTASWVGLVLSGLLVWLVSGASSAAAQRSTAPVAASLYGSTRSHDVRLVDDGEATLAFPAPEEYALPIVGVILGGAMAAGGAGVFVVVGLGALLTAGFGNDASWSAPYLLGGLAGGAVGGVILGFSIDALVQLGRRRRAARDARDASTGISSAFVSPMGDGVMAGAVGTF
jgi:hypothetical protein